MATSNNFEDMKPMFKESYSSGKKDKKKLAALLALKKKKGQLNNSSSNLPTPDKAAASSGNGLDYQSNIDPDDPFKRKLFPRINKLFKKAK
jgi:hypothetical protein